MRKLEVTVAGKWFVVLTVLLGVVAINSGNNVIYLIESMLLSGLILSGVLSELAISSVQMSIQRHHCFARGSSRDLIELENRSRFFLFCIEVGEWKGKKFVPLAFVPRLAAKKKIKISSEAMYPERGVHSWDGLVVATMYPFGFARKLRVIRKEGQRIVWPTPLSRGQSLRMLQETERVRDRELEISEGDIREYRDGDDPKLIVWTLSAKRGEFLIRERRRAFEPKEFVLEVKNKSPEELERAISVVTSQLEMAAQAGSNPALIVKAEVATRYTSREAALDALALVKAA